MDGLLVVLIRIALVCICIAVVGCQSFPGRKASGLGRHSIESVESYGLDAKNGHLPRTRAKSAVEADVEVLPPPPSYTVRPVTYLTELEETASPQAASLDDLPPDPVLPPRPTRDPEGPISEEDDVSGADTITRNISVPPAIDSATEAPVQVDADGTTSYGDVDSVESSSANLGMPVDLSWALRTAAGQNPQVAFANARIQAAYARHQAAQALWLPHIQFGASVYSHYGQLQNAVGRVFDADRGTIYTGFGSRASGTGSPRFPGLASQFHLGDAYFQPQITCRTSAARQHQAAATTNDVLLSTSIAYLDLLSAKQLEAIASETRQRAEELAKLTSSFAEAGQGAYADADRARAELTSRINQVEKAREAGLIASARLAEQLSLDDRATLMPIEQTVIPLDLVPPEMDQIGLIETALTTRNELIGSRHLVEAACARLRREQTAAFVPNLGVAMSYGGFGGGFDENIADNFDDRFDLDAYAFWTVRNLGIGERAARCEAAAELNQRRAAQTRIIDQIVREVSAAFAKVQARRRRIEITRKGISSAKDAYERDVTRIREGEGFPIEALSSLNGIDRSKRDYLEATIEYNQAQFELQRAIGWPGGESNIPSLAQE